MPTRKKSCFRVVQLEAKTLSWWRARQAKIDMDPPYQRRGGLWSAADKAYLIDSILNGFDIPKLYVADFNWGDSPLNRKRLPYAIIDGKQRLEAIFDFYEGRIALNADFVYRDDHRLSLAGLSYPELLRDHADIAEIFDNYNLSVMSVSASSDEPIRELFIRLNRSKPLTGAEIRNAMSGPAPKVIRKLAQHDFFRESVSFGMQRGQDHNAAAKLLMFEHYEKPTETKKRIVDEFVRHVSTNKGVNRKLELAGRHVLDVLEVMAAIFLPKDPLLNSPGVLPVYYWFIRAQPDRLHHRIWEFLRDFEDSRRLNRQSAGTHRTGFSLDPELVQFDMYNRSTNDLQSHEGRIRILETRFRSIAAHSAWSA